VGVLKRTRPLLLTGGAKVDDDDYIYFGRRDGSSTLSTYDARIGYSSSDGCAIFTAYRPDAATTSYGYGLKFDLDNLFIATGARKCRGIQISGDRESAVMGGDAHDMLLNLSYTNYGVNTPAGSYARGLSLQVNNRDTGALSSLEGAFIGVRQRGTGAVPTLEGLQIDIKVDASKTAPSSLMNGLRVELDLCGNMPTDSYGVVVRNRTDGNYTEPTAAFKAINDATSGCQGFDYGLDLMSAAGKATVRLGEIRLSAQDANNLPCVIFAGSATDDAGIVSAVGADTLWADGSLYISVVDGGGLLFQKRNDTWTSI